MDILNNTPPTSVFNVGNQNRVNGSSDDIVAYFWHDVEGIVSLDV